MTECARAAPGSGSEVKGLNKDGGCKEKEREREREREKAKRERERKEGNIAWLNPRRRKGREAMEIGDSYLNLQMERGHLVMWSGLVDERTGQNFFACVPGRRIRWVESKIFFHPSSLGLRVREEKANLLH